MKSAKDVTLDTTFLKVMVVGTYGTGKSIFASTFPTPGYIFDFDSGIETYMGKDFNYDQFPRNWKGWVMFEKALTNYEKEVREHDHYKTTIVDSTSAMTDLAMERALMLNPMRSETDGPIWNVHYQIVKNLMLGTLRRILDLKTNVIVISHIDIVRNPKTGNIVDIVPLLTGTLREFIPGQFQEVYYATTKRGDKGTKWLLQTVPIGLTKARSRLSGVKHLLPDYIPNNYNALMKYLRKGEKKNGLLKKPNNKQQLYGNEKVMKPNIK